MKTILSNWSYLNCIFDEIILVSDKAKSAGIALAMASIFNAVWGQKKPSQNVKINVSNYLYTAIFTILLSSCYYRPQPVSLAVNYHQDDYKETETVVFSGNLTAYGSNGLTQKVTTQINKQLKPTKYQELRLRLDLPPNSFAEKNFFFKIDQQKYKFDFDSIIYFQHNSLKTITEIDTSGTSTVTTFNQSHKTVEMRFKIPNSIKNKLITSNQLLIRYYIDETPRELIFHTPHKPRAYYDESKSATFDDSDANELVVLKEFLTIESDTDYQNYLRRHRKSKKYY